MQGLLPRLLSQGYRALSASAAQALGNCNTFIVVLLLYSTIRYAAQHYVDALWHYHVATYNWSLVLYLIESFHVLLSLTTVLLSVSIFAVSTLSRSNSCKACWDKYHKHWDDCTQWSDKLLRIRCYALPFFSVEVQRGRAQHLLTESSSTAVSPPLSHISKPDTQTKWHKNIYQIILNKIIHWETYNHLSKCAETLFHLGPIRLHFLWCPLRSASPAPVIYFLICVLVIVNRGRRKSVIHEHAQCINQKNVQNNPEDQNVFFKCSSTSFTWKFLSYCAVLYGQMDFCFVHSQKRISDLCKQRKEQTVTFKD